MAIVEQVIHDRYAIYNGDCVDVMRGLPDNSIHYTIFSPPFVDLYSYSDDPRDLGNCHDYAEFFIHFQYVISELARLTKPGRVVSVHCIDIPAMKERDGYIGLKDFPGDIIRAFQAAGFIYHSRHIIWKDPLIEATRTKALGLMHKQLCKDSSMSRAGLPDYLLSFRQHGDNEEAVTHKNGLSAYAGSKDPGGTGEKRSHNIWRAYASPVWMDIRQTHTLNKNGARDENDEKHICPLQLDVIERGITLWSNPGDVVFTPFAGIGSEVYGAVVNDRRGIGAELKQSYFNQAKLNLVEALSHVVEQPDLFSAVVA